MAISIANKLFPWVHGPTGLTTTPSAVRFAWARFTAAPSTVTIVQSSGVDSITYTSAGLYVVNLVGPACTYLMPISVGFVDDTALATAYWQARFKSTDAAAMTATIDFSTIVKANAVTGGLAVTDTFDEAYVCVAVIGP